MLEEHHARVAAEFTRECRVLDRVGERAHALPVLRRLRRVAAGDPHGGAPVPLGGGQRLAGRLEVMREQGGVLVEIAARGERRARHGAV